MAPIPLWFQIRKREGDEGSASLALSGRTAQDRAGQSEGEGAAVNGSRTAAGVSGPAFWRVQRGERSMLIEAEASLFGRKAKLRKDHVEVARPEEPNPQHPFIEFDVPGEPGLVLVLVCEASGVSFHLFADGLNLKGGEPLDDLRERAPKPIDRYEQNVLRSGVFDKDNGLVAAFVLAIFVGGVTGVASGSILVLIAAAVIAAVAVTAWVAVVRRFAFWLGTKKTWHDGLRAEAVFLLMISPMVLLFVLGAIYGGK